MIRPVVFWFLLHVTSCKDNRFYIDHLTPEKDTPVTLPPHAGNYVHFRRITGTLSPDSLAQLTITKLELITSNATQLEPGAACSPPSLTSLGLYTESTSITVTKAMLKNCEKLESLSIGGIFYRRNPLAIDAVTDLPNLKELTLTFMDLHKLTKDYFRNLTSLESLTLHKCFIEEIDSNAFGDLANLKNLEVIADSWSTQSVNIIFEVPLEVEKFTLEGRNGSLTKSKFKVTEFRFQVSLQLDGIEAGAACPTSSVRKLTLEFRTSNSIIFTKETMENCGNVEELWVKADHHHLSEVEADTFLNLVNLKSFSLENVKIKHLTKDTFKNSLLLENLRLCKGDVLEVDSGAFNHLQHLKTVEIGLQFNSSENAQKILKNSVKTNKLTLTHLSGKLSLPQFQEVKELSLDFTSLQEVKSGVCSSPTLKNFSLKFIPGDNFVLRKDSFKCKNLEELSLTASGSSPTDVPEEAFQHLSHLKVLSLTWLNFNPLKRDFFKNLQSLEKLVFHWCFITEIQTDAFNDLENLKVLQILGTRQLKQFPQNLLVKNVKLEKLSLADSDITDLTWDEFKGPASLTTLDLSDNPISSIDAEKIARNIPHLKRLNVELTLLSDDEYARFMEELKKKLNVTFGYD